MSKILGHQVLNDLDMPRLWVKENISNDVLRVLRLTAHLALRKPSNGRTSQRDYNGEKYRKCSLQKYKINKTFQPYSKLLKEQMIFWIPERTFWSMEVTLWKRTFVTCVNKNTTNTSKQVKGHNGVTAADPLPPTTVLLKEYAYRVNLSSVISRSATVINWSSLNLVSMISASRGEYVPPSFCFCLILNQRPQKSWIRKKLE